VKWKEIVWYHTDVAVLPKVDYMIPLINIRCIVVTNVDCSQFIIMIKTYTSVKRVKIEPISLKSTSHMRINY